MQKKIGFIFGILFILVAVANFVDTPTIFCLNVIGNLLIGIAFIESSYFGDMGKVIQVITTVLYSIVAVLGNDSNNLVPVVAIIFAVLLADKYFSNKKNLSRYYPIVPFMTALLSDWRIVAITTHTMLYVGLTAVLFIIQNDKV